MHCPLYHPVSPATFSLFTLVSIHTPEGMIVCVNRLCLPERLLWDGSFHLPSFLTSLSTS